MKKSMSKSVVSNIIFDSENSRDVFNAVLDEYSSGVITLMGQLSIAKGYGSADAKIEVLGDEIRVSLIDKDKGTVLTKDGFLPHKTLAGGTKYVTIKEGKPAVSIKAVGDSADTFLGFGSDIPTIVSELNKDHDIAKIIEGSTV